MIAQIGDQLRALNGMTNVEVTVVEVSLFRNQLSIQISCTSLSSQCPAQHDMVLSRPEDYWERMLMSSPSRKVLIHQKNREQITFYFEFNGHQVDMEAKLTADQLDALRKTVLKNLRDR
jgi:hypothetical protein